ncbi:hypothetical protein [Deinococcus radiophilus]|uniref:hypothetical protein n=1 Tax=Deinococcus radiophilus TaxID=32062 RepID=UPI00360C489B
MLLPQAKLPEGDPMSIAQFARDFRRLTPSERSMWRWPMMWLGTAAIVVVPSLYAGINLASALDPYGNLQASRLGWSIWIREPAETAKRSTWAVT